jgi:hypothetical protein
VSPCSCTGQEAALTRVALLSGGEASQTDLARFGGRRDRSGGSAAPGSRRSEARGGDAGCPGRGGPWENPSWRADVVAGVGSVARRGLPLGSRGPAGLGRFGGRSHLVGVALRRGACRGSGARRGARELFDWQKPSGGKLARAVAGSKPRSSSLASSESWERRLVEGGVEGSAEPEAKPDGNRPPRASAGAGVRTERWKALWTMEAQRWRAVRKGSWGRRAVGSESGSGWPPARRGASG